MTTADLIERIGGTVAVADLCQCSPQAVSQWKSKGLPKSRELYLRAVRPDAFVERRKNCKAGKSLARA